MIDEQLKKGRELATRLFAGYTGPRNPMPKGFSELTMAHLFGGIWQNEDLPLIERSMVTCTILVALNRENEQRLHFQGAKNLGITRAKMEAMIEHAAHYTGWPNAVTAFKVLAETYDS
jgi:4-carboxymuconolactone decarboxylase